MGTFHWGPPYIIGLVFSWKYWIAGCPAKERRLIMFSSKGISWRLGKVGAEAFDFAGAIHMYHRRISREKKYQRTVEESILL